MVFPLPLPELTASKDWVYLARLGHTVITAVLKATMIVVMFNVRSNTGNVGEWRERVQEQL